MKREIVEVDGRRIVLSTKRGACGDWIAARPVNANPIKWTSIVEVHWVQRRRINL